MEVRRATVQDAEQIAAVHVTTWQVAYRGQVPDAFLDAMSVERLVEAWTGITSTPDWPRRGAIVVELNHQVVGFVCVSPSRDQDATAATGEVMAIYVHPESWRTGAGRALLGAGCDSLRAAGFTTVTLWVLESNEPSIRFYDAMGWRADGECKVDDRGDFTLTEIRYRRDL